MALVSGNVLLTYLLDSVGGGGGGGGGGSRCGCRRRRRAGHPTLAAFVRDKVQILAGPSSVSHLLGRAEAHHPHVLQKGWCAVEECSSLGWNRRNRRRRRRRRRRFPFCESKKTGRSKELSASGHQHFLVFCDLRRNLLTLTGIESDCVRNLLNCTDRQREREKRLIC